MNDKEQLKSKVLKDIQKSGFISEMKVNSILIKKGWIMTLCGESFLDKDLNKSREIDIITFRRIANEDNSVVVNFQLAIEVKKSEKPWVIFCQKKENFFHNLSSWVMLKDTENISFSELSYEDMGENFRHANSKFYGSAYTEAFKAPSEVSQIYSALMTACKAAYSFQKESPKEIKVKKEVDKYHSLSLYLPIVVLNGVMFESKLNSEGDAEIEEVQYCPITLNYSSENYSQNRFFPEIVTINEFENHLDLLMLWQNKLFKKICDNLGYA